MRAESGRYESVWVIRHQEWKGKNFYNKFYSTYWITALGPIVVFESEGSGRSVSISYSRSLVRLGNSFPFHNSEICFRATSLCLPMSHLSSKIDLDFAACAGRDTHTHWLAVRVLRGSMLFVGLPSAIISFGSARRFQRLNKLFMHEP